MEEQENSDSSVMAKISSSRPSTQMEPIDCGDQDDRFSELPDPIIQYILSFLTVEVIIRTSVLSKRWRAVWTAVPTLNFCGYRYLYTYELVSFVNKTLRHYTGSKVEKFLVGIIYREYLKSQVDKWVRFVTRRQVEELSLDLNDAAMSDCSDCQPYDLPQCIFSCSSLTLLNTIYCDFQPNGRVCWTKLKVLSIGYSELSNEIMAEILSGSPILEFLKLRACDGINQLDIVSSSNLKELVIDSLLWDVTPIEISAPNIHSISLLGCMFTEEYKLLEISSLIEANLSFDLIDYRTSCDMLNRLLGKLRHVQKLTIGPWFLTILSKCNVQYPIFCKLKSLTIESSINEGELPAIAILLENTPELEKLTMNITTSKKEKVEMGGEKSLTWKERFYKCLSCNLKIVEITGLEPRFARLNTHYSLVEFLLNNAKVLEKMAIHVKTDYFSGSWQESGIEKKVQDFAELNRLILSYPRGSPNAVVLLDNPFN